MLNRNRYVNVLGDIMIFEIFTTTNLFIFLGGVLLLGISILSMGTCINMSKTTIIMFTISTSMTLIGILLLGFDVLQYLGIL